MDFLEGATSRQVRTLSIDRSDILLGSFELKKPLECAVDPGFIHKSRLSGSCMNLQWLTPYLQVEESSSCPSPREQAEHTPGFDKTRFIVKNVSCSRMQIRTNCKNMLHICHKLFSS